jgi:hypothetical protein
LCCEKTVASNIWKNHLAQIWWDFVKRIGTIKPIRWYLDTIHTLVVRVWRIGLRVICGRCSCFGTHDTRTHLTSHRYHQVKIHHEWVWTIRNCVPSPFNMLPWIFQSFTNKIKKKKKVTGGKVPRGLRGRLLL